MTDQTQRMKVVGRDGFIGWIDPADQRPNQMEVTIRLSTGQAMLISPDLLVPQKDGSFYLPMSRDQFEHLGADERSEKQSGETYMVIPVIVEDLDVEKRTHTRRVRVSKHVHEREEVIEDTGFHEEVKVDRVPVNKVVDQLPEVRREGDTTIIPVLEEVLVVEKRVVLKEEVRITKRRVKADPQRVTLRAESVDVERIQGDQEIETNQPKRRQ
jgi:stress response protein YsnF